MTRTRRPPGRARKGFSLLEIQAAFIVLGFSMAALVPFAIAQLKLVSALEKRLPPNTTYVLMSRDHGLVSLMAAGGGRPPQQAIQVPPGGDLSTSSAPPSTATTPNFINVGQPQPGPGPGPMDMSTTVTVKKVP